MYNHQLDTFLKAAELGSFSKAAEELCISPSAVLQQIRSLEGRLGVQLFLRTSHGIRLTEAGKVLEKDARIMISFSEESRRRILAAAGAGEHVIRLGTSLHFRPRCITRMLDQYLALHPDVQVRVSAITDKPDAGSPFPLPGTSYDIREGIRFRMKNDTSRSFLLYDSPVVLAVPQKHTLYDRRELSVEDLAGQELMMLEPGHLAEMDLLRQELLAAPGIRILDQAFYGMDTFSYAKRYGVPFIAEPVYGDLLGPDFRLIPIRTDITVPYELAFAEHLPPAAADFLSWLSDSWKEERFRRAVLPGRDSR